MKNNMLHLYIGDGKGKTCTAYGLILRALGHGFKVSVFSFLKSEKSGELIMLRKLKESFYSIDINVAKKEHNFFSFLSDEEKKEVQAEVSELFEKFKDTVINSKADIIILDEIIDAVNLKLIDEDELIKILLLRKSEIILTGRNPSEKLTEIADYISDVNKIKHPYDKGVPARKGIEF